MATPIPLVGTADDDIVIGSEDADFIVLDGGGSDYAAGGAGNDSFYFGAAFAAGDGVNGGDGAGDTLILQGRYVLNMGEVGLAGVETMVLMSAADTRFGASGSGTNVYHFTAADANVAAGAQLTVQGNRLGGLEVFSFIGMAETDGSFRLIGGAANDLLIGGWGADMLVGGLGSDLLNGFLGNDMFVYRSTAESSTAAPDEIAGLMAGDLIDLRMIDADTGQAGDQAFDFIGSDAFHSVAGELRVFQDGGSWRVQADTNGDGLADFEIEVNMQLAQPLDASYFLL